LPGARSREQQDRSHPDPKASAPPEALSVVNYTEFSPLMDKHSILGMCMYVWMYIYRDGKREIERTLTAEAEAEAEEAQIGHGEYILRKTKGRIDTFCREHLTGSSLYVAESQSCPRCSLH
jgi:hypothetical protein